MIDKAALGKLSAATSINRDLHALYITRCRKLHTLPSRARMSYRVKDVHTPLSEDEPCHDFVDHKAQKVRQHERGAGDERRRPTARLWRKS